MSEVIVLSDSDESASSEKKGHPREVNPAVEENFADDFAFSDVEFPEIQFNDVPEPNRNRENSPARLASQRHCSDDLEKSSDEDSPNLQNYDPNSRRQTQRVAHVLSESGDESGNESDNARRTRKAAKDKNRVVEERLRKRQQLAREKALKAVTLKKLKDISPGECMKYMEVVLDEAIDRDSFGTEIKNALIGADLKYSISSNSVPYSITWKRRVEENYVDGDNKICTRVKTETVDQAMIIWKTEEVLGKVAERCFSESVASVKSLFADSKLSLIVFGAEEYFSYIKSKKSNKHDDKRKTQRSNKNTRYADLPDVSRNQLETCLNEIQITVGCNSRLIDTAQDLALTVCQYTKAIAETPYKIEKNKGLTDRFDWYVMGDNRNTVRVDKDGNGLKRLWQQQLCQFNLSSLEIAEAICSVYPSPAHLMEAYLSCSEKDGTNLLKDIPIRRAAGPLTTTRKIGIELSRRVYVMFTSENGDETLQ